MERSRSSLSNLSSWYVSRCPFAMLLLIRFGQSGTIRQNLDPFATEDDASLNDALRAAGLFSLQKNLPEKERITLDSIVGSAGGNFSLGQRQILALARALVRRSRVLILDEATASLGTFSECLIRSSIPTTD